MTISLKTVGILTVFFSFFKLRGWGFCVFSIFLKHNLHRNVSGLSANAKHVKDFKYPVQHSSMLPDHTPCMTYVYGMLSVSTTVCKILYIWCDVGSILSNMCLNSHCCLFVFGFFFVFPLCHVYFIMRTPLGEEKLLFLCKYSSLF